MRNGYFACPVDPTERLEMPRRLRMVALGAVVAALRPVGHLGCRAAERAKAFWQTNGWY
jgi:hypothetical protein